MNFIFIFGAQGSGKTTVARMLKEKLHSVHIDFDWIRGFHLDPEWKDATPEEEEMSIQNMVYILQNYAKHHYMNVITSGFSEQQIEKVASNLSEYQRCIVTLYLTDNDILKERVLTESRDSGFRDFAQSIKLNAEIASRPLLQYEHKIDTTSQTPQQTTRQILDLLKDL